MKTISNKYLGKLYKLAHTLLLLSTLGYAKEEVRAVFDIGSGTTTVLVVNFDTVKNSIIGPPIYIKEVAIPFQKDLLENKNRGFTKKFQEKAFDQIKELKMDISKLKIQSFSSVATAAFREAKNSARNLTKKINSQLGINLKIISQKEEAILGFQAVQNIIKENDNDFVVWDVGGGSIQMTHFSKDKNYYESYLGKLASEKLNQVISNKLSMGQKVTTPNPIGHLGANSAIKYSKKYALENIPQKMRNQFQNKKFYGIGGVWNYSLPGQVGSRNLTYKAIRQRMSKNKHLPDEMINRNPAFARTDVTNLALILGHMEVLNISQVEPIKAKLAEGVFYNKNYWQHHK